MRSASAFLQGCQITNFTKFKINSRNLGSTFLHKYGLVVLRQHVINFQQRHFGVKDSKHQCLSSSNGVCILLGLAGKRGQGSHFFGDSPDAKHWAVHVGTWNFNIIYPHSDMKLLFLPAVSAGFRAGELGELHFGLGTTPPKWCENVGKMRNLT